MNSTSIPIKEITIRRCDFPLAKQVTYTSGEKDEDLVLFLVSISDGRETGYGECIPTSLIYPEGHIGRSPIDEWGELRKLCGELIGRDATGLGRLLQNEAYTHDFNSILDAVDFALHDLVGKRLGTPVSVLLGGRGRPYVWAMPVVHTSTPEAMIEKMVEFNRRHGIRLFKLKPIGRRDADVEILRKTRERLGPSVEFYMDSNYALKMSVAEVIDYINELSGHGLVMYEDALDVDFETFAYIRRRVKAKIMIDEKARDDRAVMKIIETGAADQINIHANWSGGFQPGMKKAILASAGGLSTMIGSTYYLGVGAAAYQILSSALPLEAPCEQVDVRVYGERSFAKEPFELKEGKIFIRNSPGLGVELDLAGVEEITTKTETVT